MLRRFPASSARTSHPAGPRLGWGSASIWPRSPRCLSPSPPHRRFGKEGKQPARLGPSIEQCHAPLLV